MKNYCVPFIFTQQRVDTDLTKEKLEEVLEAMGQMLCANDQRKQHIIPRQVDAWKPMWITWTIGLRKIHLQDPGQKETSKAMVPKVLQEVSIMRICILLPKVTHPNQVSTSVT